MKNHSPRRASLALLLCLCLSLQGVALAAGKNGKKYFKEGSKYESAEQWDLAAEQYALAVADEPGNAEYKLRLLRSMQMASLMFAARGDVLAVKDDYAGAYNAYARAANYDPTNESMRLKMVRMLEQQKAQMSGGEAARYNPRTGNLVPASNEIRTPARPARGDVLQKIEYKDGTSLKLVIENLARLLNLNVVFDDSFKDTSKFSLSLNEVTLAKAMDILLMQNKLIFELADRRTLVVYADNQPNRQRLERLLVKTFYLSNADLNETRTIVQANLGTQRQVQASKQLNALVIRATPSELAIAQSLIDSLDKNRAEVVIDVGIYEVSNTTSLELGNQLATSGQTTTKTTYDSSGNAVTVTTGTSGSLSDLGGLGRAGISAIAGNLFGVGGGIGTIIGLPPSSLSLLQTKGNSKLLANTQIHALDGEQNQTVVGRSVPVRLGTSYLTATTTTAQAANTGTVDNIQYRDVGLVIDITPTITNEGYVQVKMKLESSNVESSATDSSLTPTFTKRSLTTISRVQDGVTAVVAGVKQDNKGDTRATIPVIGMVPILGRLFTTPKQTSSQSDIVITVTPHIIRSAEIKPEDHLARLSGTQQAGIGQSIEEVVFRAQAEEELERRAIAQNPVAPKWEAEAVPRILQTSNVAPSPASVAPAQPNDVTQPTPAPAKPIEKVATPSAQTSSIWLTLTSPLAQPGLPAKPATQP
ncbi:MAG: secretin N-terminal domain-containing protein [Acidobacteriota bacterium]